MGVLKPLDEVTTYVNFGYGYWHMELTGSKHIRGL